MLNIWSRRPSCSNVVLGLPSRYFLCPGAHLWAFSVGKFTVGSGWSPVCLFQRASSRNTSYSEWYVRYFSWGVSLFWSSISTYDTFFLLFQTNVRLGQQGRGVSVRFSRHFSLSVVPADLPHQEAGWAVWPLFWSSFQSSVALRGEVKLRGADFHFSGAVDWRQPS